MILNQIPLSGYLAIGIVLILLIREVISHRQKAKRMPPGPQSLAQVAPKISPKAPQWVIFDSLKDNYGPIFSFFRGATPVIVINKAQIALDLLQKRGEIYSSRPRLVLAHELVSGGLRGLTAPYGKIWRTWRKIQNTGMSGRASLAYREHQTLESALTMRGILQSPENYGYHFDLFATSVVMSIAYGRRTANFDDPLFKKHQECMLDFQKANVSNNPVNIYPSLLNLPRPLQWFRKEADKSYAKAERLYTSLLTDVMKKCEAGTARESMAARCLRDQKSLGFSELELAFAVTAPFGAGIETTAATFELGLCAMLHNPTAMRKAQEELDHVVGRERFPIFQDEASLPYVGAWLKELNRWWPIAPLAVPHAVTTDDVYEGHFIPKGATVFGNLYTMMRDQDMFPEPETFRPERFLETEDPQLIDFTLAFGFGRRHCPGMHVALQSMFIVLSRLLWAFDVSPTTDDAGSPILPDMNASQILGLTRKPARFTFKIRPRFSGAVALVEKEAAEAEMLLKAWD